MTGRLVAAVLSLAIAIAIAACAGGGDAPPAREGRATAARPPAAPPDRGVLRVGPVGRVEVAVRAAVPVRVEVPDGARRLTATLRLPGGRQVALAAPRRLRGTGARELSLPVAPRAARAVAGCTPAVLVVAAETPGGRALARGSTALPGTPPDCARFFGGGAVWNQPLTDDAPLDPLSDTLVAELNRQVEAEYDRRYPPMINTTSYSAPVYTVPRDQPRVPVRLTRGQDYGHALQAVLNEGVPIPVDARPAAGGDAHLVVWQPSTDTMWELWTARRVDGAWQAGWGGRMEDMSSAKGYFSDPWGIHPGATASSLPLAGGLITLHDLATRRIDHALAMAVPSTRYGVWALPAQRSDGPARRPDAIPMGARFRLDPRLDVAALDLPPLTRMLARSAQRYGILVRDTAPVVTLYAQDPTPTGENPWPALIAPTPSSVLRAFPWARLQVMAMDLRTYGNKRVAR